jgi:hypothetical protein
VSRLAAPRLALLALLGLTALPAAAAPGQSVRVVHRDPLALPTRGPLAAPVTLELFFTAEMVKSASFAAAERLAALHPSRIRLVYRILGGTSSRLPYALLEAQAEGKFFEAIARFTAKPGLSDQQLADAARALGLDPQRMLAAMHDPPPAYRQLIDANERRRKQKIRGNQIAMLLNGRAPRQPLTAMSVNDLEREYQAARAAAELAADEGASADPTTVDPADIAINAGPTDDEPDTSNEPPLATPPLPLAGLPSLGPSRARVTIVVPCSPTSANCMAPLRNARTTQELYPEDVRVVWAPFFDVTRDDAAELGELGDAALCAEQVGTSSENDFELPGSPGWRWVDAMLSEAASRHRGATATSLIDKVAARLKVDHAAFAECRARLAGATLAWIEAARRAGVHTTPSTVIGGRIYAPINEPGTLELLVEQELRPGVLGELGAALAPVR